MEERTKRAKDPHRLHNFVYKMLIGGIPAARKAPLTCAEQLGGLNH